MIKGTPELIAGRREEIINACEQLYRTMSFREITLKEIGSLTSFSRPTIYNYFETKEEIFLALFQREYDRWNGDLNAILDENERLTKAEIAEKIALSLSGREQLLKLLSMNNYDMEANSRQELLTAFKQSYGRSMQLLSMLLEKFCPDMSAAEIRSFIYTFYPFMFGIYPYTAVTEKQRTAMEEAGINYVYQSVYELTYSCLIRLLGEWAADEKQQVSLAWLLTKVTSPVVGATKKHHIEWAAKAVDLELGSDEIACLEEPCVPHPLAGVMAQNKPAAAKENHVWSTGDQKIGT